MVGAGLVPAHYDETQILSGRSQGSLLQIFNSLGLRARRSYDIVSKFYACEECGDQGSRETRIV